MDKNHPIYASEQFRKRRDELFRIRIAYVLEEFAFCEHYTPSSLAEAVLAYMNLINQNTNTVQPALKLNLEPILEKTEPVPVYKGEPIPAPVRAPSDCPTCSPPIRTVHPIVNYMSCEDRINFLKEHGE